MIIKGAFSENVFSARFNAENLGDSTHGLYTTFISKNITPFFERALKRMNVFEAIQKRRSICN